MNMFWFISDLPVLMSAMTCYLLAGTWTLVEWKYRESPSVNQNNSNLSASPLPSGNTTVDSNRDKRSGRKAKPTEHPMQLRMPPSQKTIGESTRQMFFKCLVFAFFCRFLMMPFQAWYFHSSIMQSPKANMNILVCVPDSAGCVVSRTLPEILFASAFFVLLILYAQLIAAICGYPSFTSQASPSNYNSRNSQNIDDRLSHSGSVNKDRHLQQQTLNSNYNHHPNNNIAGYHHHNIEPLDRSTSSSNGIPNHMNNNAPSSSPSNAKYLLSCHERILLKLLYHETTFSTTNIIMYSIYGICLFFSAIIPLMSFAQMQQILWIMLSAVYGTCLLVTVIWVLPSLYHQFYKKINDFPGDHNNDNSHDHSNANTTIDQGSSKNAKQKKLFCKMWTSSAVCVFVYGGRTINFIWNAIFSMSGEFYKERKGLDPNLYNSFLNTSLGRDSALNLCFELIPACIIVGLMRYPTKSQQPATSLPPVTTVIQHTFSSSSQNTAPTSYNPIIDQYGQSQSASQLKRSVSARGSDQHHYHHHHSTTTSSNSNNINNPRIYDVSTTGGMKRAVSAKAAVTTSPVSTKPSPIEHMPLLGIGTNNVYGTNSKNDDDNV